MRQNVNKNIALLAMLLCTVPIALLAQQPKISNLRAYDKTGINVFETPKNDTVPFNGMKLRFGAGFTQQFQNLKDQNPGALDNNVGSYSATSPVAGNKLIPLTPGFQTAMANLFMDVQLAAGIRMNVTSYLSTKHHNETWVKGGYIQFDKIPIKCKIIDQIMQYTTIKVGHMEINYGDEHFRRSDGGQTLYNPFMENYIMDEFATEIGGEVYVQKNGIFGMIGVSNGQIKGNVDSFYNAAHVTQPIDPSIYLKAGIDKQVAKKIRLRFSASYYENRSCPSNTLFGGDRSGSNYQFVMEENSANQSSTTGAGTGLAFSGRFNPGFTNRISTYMLNGFAKISGFEFFGTYENAEGRTVNETSDRQATQYAVEGVYRFNVLGGSENIFLGVRYNSVTARLANSSAGTGAGPITYTGDVTVNRVAFAGGWFLTKNILLKGEYVIQKYLDFPTADYRAGGKFDGYVVEAIVGF